MAAFSLVASQPGPVFRLAAQAAPPGTAVSVAVSAPKRPMVLRFEGLGQEGGFYRSGTDRWTALVAVPLGTAAGKKSIRVFWGRQGALEEKELILRVARDRYPASPQPLRVRQFRKKLYEHLPREKDTLARAWDNAGGPPQWKGFFSRPLEKEWPVSSVFGKKRVYENGQAAWSHKGLDYAAPEGALVVAPNHGDVLLAREDFQAYGGVVVLGHGYQVASTYMHLSKVTVRPGQRVRRGQILGRAGSAGIATGAHLHWQITLRGIPVDPAPWLEKRLSKAPVPLPLPFAPGGH